MKNNQFIIFLLIFFIVGGLQAQLKIHSTGQISTGSLSTTQPGSSTDILLGGNVEIRPRSTEEIGAIHFGTYRITSPMIGTIYYPQITGAANSTLNLGSSLNRIYTLYTLKINSINAGQIVSDGRCKKNIKGMGLGLSKIMQLRSVYYDLDFPISEDAPSELRETLKDKGKNKVGYIAQEVKEVIPEAVEYDQEMDLYTMDYTAIIPYLTKAIQEQQRVIENLQKEVKNLKTPKKNNSKGGSEGSVEIEEEIGASRTHSLYQNSPNPFHNRTEISYYIGAGASKAQICIYDLNGTQLKCLSVSSQEGVSSVWLDASDLKAGMYLYGLLIGDRLIDMKKMVLTN